MAGISYRSCDFDVTVGDVLSSYNESIRANHANYRSNLDALSVRLARFSELDSLDTSLNALLRTYGIRDRSELRSNFGYASQLEEKRDGEEWLLSLSGLIVVNGKFLPRTGQTVDLRPYRTVTEVAGVSTLRTALASAKHRAYTYYIVHENITYAGVPPAAVARQLGVEVSDLDQILFVWFGAANSRARSVLVSQGFPSSSLYSILRGRNYKNIETVILPRLDLFNQLSAMGLTERDLTTLFERDIQRVTVDTAMRRADDDEGSIPGVYQTTPYPSEIAAAFRSELRKLPVPGSRRTGSGARIWVPALAVLAWVLDYERSFSLTSYVRGTSDIVGPANQRSQAFLSSLDTNTSEIAASFRAFSGAAAYSLIQAGQLLEDSNALFGVDLECGITSASNGGGSFQLGRITFKADLSASIQAAEEDYAEAFAAAHSPFSLRVSLLQAATFGLSGLVCSATALGCASSKLLDDLGAEGGVFDYDGATDTARLDVMNSLDVSESLVSDLINAANDVVNGFAASSNLFSARMNACVDRAATNFLNGLRSATS